MWFASVVRRWWGWAGERLGGRLLLLLLFTWPGISKKENRAQGRARVASSAGWFLCPFGTSVLLWYVCVRSSLVAVAVRVGWAGIRWLRSKSLVMVVVL